MALWAQYLLIYESDEGVQRATRAPKTPQSYRERISPGGVGLHRRGQQSDEKMRGGEWRGEKCLEHAEEVARATVGARVRVCEQEKFI